MGTPGEDQVAYVVDEDGKLITFEEDGVTLCILTPAYTISGGTSSDWFTQNTEKPDHAAEIATFQKVLVNGNAHGEGSGTTNWEFTLPASGSLNATTYSSNQGVSTPEISIQ